MSSHLWLVITQVIIAMILVTILFYQYYTKQIKPLAWILSIVFIAFLRNVFDLTIELFHLTEQPIAILEYLITSVSFLLLYFYLEFTLYNRPYLPRFTIMLTIYGMFLITFLIELFGGKINYPASSHLASHHHAPSLFELPFDLFSITVWGLATYTFFLMYRHAIVSRVRLVTFLLTTASLIFTVVQVIEISEFFIDYNNPPEATSVALPGLVLLIVVDIIYPDFSYSSPVRIYRLMLFHEMGPVILNLTIDEKYQADQLEPSLVGGIASSLNTAYMEITQQKAGSIRKLTMDQVTFIFSRSTHIFSILEIERSTHIIRSALRSFTDEFAMVYAAQIKKASRGIFKFEGYERLFHKYFPFIAEVKSLN